MTASKKIGLILLLFGYLWLGFALVGEAIPYKGKTASGKHTRYAAYFNPRPTCKTYGSHYIKREHMRRYKRFRVVPGKH